MYYWWFCIFINNKFIFGLWLFFFCELKWIVLVGFSIIENMYKLGNLEERIGFVYINFISWVIIRWFDIIFVKIRCIYIII